MRSKRTNCRLWWPSNLSVATPQSISGTSSLFFGWFISSASSSSSELSLDIVVASALDGSALTSGNLQSVLQKINGNLPQPLLGVSKFSLLGYCGADFCHKGNSPSLTSKRGKFNSLINHIRSFCGSDEDEESAGKPCGCDEDEGPAEAFRQVFTSNGNWFQLVYMSSEDVGGKHQLVPRLHHLHWNGETIYKLDLHTIIYEIPVFGGHHYSLSTWSSCAEQVTTPGKKPKWLVDLNQKESQFNLNVVILAINCVNASKILLHGHLPGNRSIVPFNLFFLATMFSWKLCALFVASFSTFIYIILRCAHCLLSYLSWPYVMASIKNMFYSTWTVLETRCCQFPYWPIFLQVYGLRAQSCVEYSEKMALRGHSVWSVLVVDVLLGNLIGILLLSHASLVFLCISNLSVEVTNNLLRTGCVWLMGNPAGFKLNTELAGVLGMMSVNIIQVWSTIWSFIGFLFVPMLKGIAYFGMLFGFTAAAALVVDMICLLTRHVVFLHWLFSLLYSSQIHALAALWRLFRGKKWNPLRLRLDSYDYTVEQHVVGSLLFTPLLLLLPTTSAFYTFFSIMNSAISFVCIVIEVCIFIIHATPYNQIFLWLVRRRRFPAGIWLQFASCQHTSFSSSVNGPPELIASSSYQPSTANNVNRSGSTILVSFLHSNHVDLGELVWPKYRDLCSSVIRSSICYFGLWNSYRKKDTFDLRYCSSFKVAMDVNAFQRFLVSVLQRRFCLQRKLSFVWHRLCIQFFDFLFRFPRSSG